MYSKLTKSTILKNFFTCSEGFFEWITPKGSVSLMSKGTALIKGCENTQDSVARRK